MCGSHRVPPTRVGIKVLQSAAAHAVLRFARFSLLRNILQILFANKLSDIDYLATIKYSPVTYKKTN